MMLSSYIRRQCHDSSSASIETVSYTHLDVYKRQPVQVNGCAADERNRLPEQC